jgi:hypothetical protein
MKKMILFFLLTAGTGKLLHAQLEKLTVYDMIFDYPRPGESNAVFTFHLPDQKKVVLEFSYISQLQYLPDLDSLVRVALAMLEPLKDSLKADGMVRRVDLSLTSATPKIRIVTHPEFLNSYTIKNKELLQLKVNQDTIRISSFATSNTVITLNRGGKKTEMRPMYSFVIMIMVNNISDVSTLPQDVMQQCVTLLKPKVDRYFKLDNHHNAPGNFRAEFNMATGKTDMPVSPRFARYEAPFTGLLGFSMNAVRGSVVPGFQAGFEFRIGNSSFYNRWRLFLELQPFFSRDPANKLIIDNNKWVTFQILQNSIRSRETNNFTLEGNFTLGYLFHRQGEWYEPNTFKFGLPVLSNKHIIIEPQFVFNGLFKNMTPSIKVSFNF